jgi:biopolymer transport protein ExbD
LLHFDDIDSTSRIYWNGEVVGRTRGAPGEKIASAAAQSTQPESSAPGQNAKVCQVALVLASAQRLGLTKIRIIGSEQFIE